MKYIEPLFRPPAEAESLIFQVAYGCPHNRCKFCGMYKSVRYHLRPPEEVIAEIAQAGKCYPETSRVFLADGDVMALPFDLLLGYLSALNLAFSRLARVNIYANGSSIMAKSDAELAKLRELKLNTLYLGLETGSQAILDLFGKTESVEEMIAAVIRAQALGFKISVMLLVGIGGKQYKGEHIRASVAALNRMQPRLLSALRFIAIPGLNLPAEYEPLTEFEAVDELLQIIQGLELKKTVFRANHTSNPVPLSGRFPQDKMPLSELLTRQLQSGKLDTKGPGDVPLFL